MFRRSGNTVETCMGSFILCQFAGIECTNNLFTKSVAQCSSVKIESLMKKGYVLHIEKG